MRYETMRFGEFLRTNEFKVINLFDNNKIITVHADNYNILGNI